MSTNWWSRHARMNPRLRVAALLAVGLVAATACGPEPMVTTTPATSAVPTAAPATAAPRDIPFSPVAWPTTGSACSLSGAGRIGRIEAPNAETVVFTLCAPDGAFLERLAHPSMGIVDAAQLARIATDPAALRDVVGHGSYRVVLWGDSNVQLGLVGAASEAASAPTVILRWAADPALRTADVVAGSVDGIDAPTAAGLMAAATNPALTVVPRPLLATSVLGFGSDAAFADPLLRRDVAMGIDRGALVDSAFPAGSTPADHIAPCEVPSGCAGTAFRGFNAPSAVAALQSLKFNFDTTYTLTVPAAPIPGLPDPAGVAAALSDQFAANLGITLQVTSMPSSEFRAAVDGGTITGLYLDGVAAAVADPSAFYDPLFLELPNSLAALRAGDARSALQAADDERDPAAREADYATAAGLLRDSVPVAPLANPGAETVYRADVRGATASPLGTDPLGLMTAGDRGQVVFEQATAPTGGWCGAQSSADAYRLCALVTDGLYGYAAGSLDPVPELATGCTADVSATVWTCRLRSLRTGDGLVLDAADVVATFRAMADPSDPVHVALGDAAFSAWTEVLGAQSGAIPTSTPTPTPTASAAPAATQSESPVPSASPSSSGGTSAP
jgi:ABC-type transport system substrate-binding protein